MTVLDVDSLSVSFGGIAAVRDVSFAAESGVVLGIIGPNGAGKSTLVNCISGVVRPRTGTVRLRGTDVTSWHPARRARSGIIRTFQAVRLFDEASAVDNVVLGGYTRHAYGIATALIGRRRELHRERRANALALLADVDFPPDAAHRPVRELSHGDRRLVELARAVAAGPAVLCLDEPTAGLNPTESLRFSAWMRAQAAAGAAVVLVSHDMPLVMRFADQVLVLRSGERLAYGPPEQIRRDPAVVDAYLGEYRDDVHTTHQQGAQQ